MKWTIKMPEGGAEGLRRALRRGRALLGYAALGLVLFMIFIWLSLPTRAIAWRIGHEARQRGLVLDIEDLSVSPFGGATLRNVTWTYAPSRPGQVPDSLFLEQVEIDVSILALLMGGVEVEVVTSIDDSTITALYERDDDGAVVKIDIDELPLYDVPKLRQALNAPVRGLFGLHVDLTVPGNKFAKAQGSIDISCTGCKVGDGESLVFIPGVSSGMMAKGVTLPEIDFGSFAGRLAVADGIAATEGIEIKSDDVLLKLTGSMTLSDPIGKSELGFDVWVQLTEALQARSDTLRLTVQTAHPNARPDPPDDAWLAFKLRGTVKSPRFMGIKTKSREERLREQREKAREAEAKKKEKAEAKKAAAAAKPEPPKPAPKPEPEPAPEPVRPSAPPTPAPTAIAEPPEPAVIAEVPDSTMVPSTAEVPGGGDATASGETGGPAPGGEGGVGEGGDTGGEPAQ